METRYWNCDRCAERIAPGDRTSLKPATGPDRHLDAYDFCSECFAQFKAWVGPGPGRVRTAPDKVA